MTLTSGRAAHYTIPISSSRENVPLPRIAVANDPMINIVESPAQSAGQSGQMSGQITAFYDIFQGLAVVVTWDAGQVVRPLLEGSEWKTLLSSMYRILAVSTSLGDIIRVGADLAGTRLNVQLEVR